jgi:transcriptional regulator with XRE-family HTH domain
MAARAVEKFAARLLELREKRGVSQTRRVELAGPNRNYVGDIERGRRNPCLDNIVKLADALGVPSAEHVRLFEKRK